MDYFVNICQKIKNLVIDLHRNDNIDNFLFKHIIDVELDDDNYLQISGLVAKYFSCSTPVYTFTLNVHS